MNSYPSRCRSRMRPSLGMMNSFICLHFEIFQDLRGEKFSGSTSDVWVFSLVNCFYRSYQLMERTLKVYVYRDGSKPVFHLPITRGIYSSEGWFMKLMEGNRHYVVRDPRRAHLFYMPFSSRHLQFATYVRGSHNRTTLRVFLQKYVESIASKYPFWNRTDGSDHFLAACHDWVIYQR